MHLPEQQPRCHVRRGRWLRLNSMTSTQRMNVPKHARKRSGGPAQSLLPIDRANKPSGSRQCQLEWDISSFPRHLTYASSDSRNMRTRIIEVEESSAEIESRAFLLNPALSPRILTAPPL